MAGLDTAHYRQIHSYAGCLYKCEPAGKSHSPGAVFGENFQIRNYARTQSVLQVAPLLIIDQIQRTGHAGRRFFLLL